MWRGSPGCPATAGSRRGRRCAAGRRARARPRVLPARVSARQTVSHSSNYPRVSGLSTYTIHVLIVGQNSCHGLVVASLVVASSLSVNWTGAPPLCMKCAVHTGAKVTGASRADANMKIYYEKQTLHWFRTHALYGVGALISFRDVTSLLVPKCNNRWRWVLVRCKCFVIIDRYMRFVDIYRIINIGKQLLLAFWTVCSTHFGKNPSSSHTKGQRNRSLSASEVLQPYD